MGSGSIQALEHRTKNSLLKIKLELNWCWTLLSWSSCLEVLVAHLGGITISQSVLEVNEPED